MAVIDFNQGELNRVREHIRKTTGISISPEKTSALQNSLQIRFQALDAIKSVDEYLKFLKYHPQGGNELKEMIKLITITKTDFFRYPPQFEALEKWVLPELMCNSQNKEIAIWSAGCATGEEPYSIALTIIRSNHSLPSSLSSVLATDINVEALETARKGIYPIRKTRNIPQSLFAKYFQKLDSESYQLDDSIKKMIDFEYHNLVDSDYPTPSKGQWDIIFCRNVSIYFDLETTREILDKFFNVVSDGGYLFIGHSESLFNIFDKFRLVEVGNILIYRKEKEPRRKFPEQRVHLFAQPHPPISPPEPTPPPASPPEPELPPPPEPNDYRLALEEFNHKHYSRALELLDGFIQENPQNPIPHLTRGNVLCDMYEYEEAVNSYQTAIEIDPLLSEAYLLLGITLRKKGDYDNAISFLKRALFVDENISPASFMLGLIYRDMGNIDQAIRELTYTIRSAEKSGNEYLNLIHSEWCLDDRPILEKDLLLKICRENLHHLEKKRNK